MPVKYFENWPIFGEDIDKI